MRKVREVLRLLWDLNQSARDVAGACGLARSTVGEYERRAKDAGLSWPLPDVDDEALEALLFPPPPSVPRELRPEPDYALVDYLAYNPTAGDLIQGTGGVRKLRWALQNRGKRGGARVLYYFLQC